jgi:glucosamine kinase
MSFHRIGVDGGGTTTRAVVIDENRVVVGRANSGSSNAYNLGYEGALRNVQLAVAGALEEAGLSAQTVESWGFGLAGVTGDAQKSAWTAALQHEYGAQIWVEEDVVAALVGAFGPDELRQSGGAVLIAEPARTVWAEAPRFKVRASTVGGRCLATEAAVSGWAKAPFAPPSPPLMARVRPRF